MKKLLLIALSTSLAMGAYAADDKKFYAGGAGSFWKLTDDSTGNANFNMSALEGAFGYEALPWLAIEARIGAGLSTDTENLGGSYAEMVQIDDPESADPADMIDAISYTSIEKPVKTKINYYGSIYLKPQIKNDTAIFYGLIGYTMLDMDATSGNTSVYSASLTGDIDDQTTWALIDGTETNDVLDDAAEISDSDGSLSFGVGVGFYFKKRYVFNIEYKNFVQSASLGEGSTSEIRASGLTFGVNYSF